MPANCLLNELTNSKMHIKIWNSGWLLQTLQPSYRFSSLSSLTGLWREILTLKKTIPFSNIFVNCRISFSCVRVCHTVWGLEEGQIANLCLALFIAMHCQCSSIHLLSVHWFVWFKDTRLTGFTGDMTVHWILETGKGVSCSWSSVPQNLLLSGLLSDWWVIRSTYSCTRKISLM